MSKVKGLSVVCDNIYGLSQDDVNMPIMKDGIPVGTITYINDKSIFGLIWDESIEFNKDNASFEIKSKPKKKQDVLFRDMKK